MTVRIPELRAIVHRPSLAVLAAGLVMAGCAAPGAQVSLGPSTSGGATPSASAPPTAPEPSKTIEAAAGWTTVATFGDGGGWDFARTVVRSGERFLAVGSRLSPVPEAIFNSGPEHLWTSTDGRSWDEVPLGPELDGVVLQGLVAGPSGGFIAFGGQQRRTADDQRALAIARRTYLAKINTNFDRASPVTKMVGALAATSS